jgi:peptidoglycan hydrolase CwlO-like protein
MKTTGILVLLAILSLSSCEQWDHLEAKAERINRYEKVSLHLSKENRDLKSEISRLRADIQTLKSEKNYLKIQLDKHQDKSASANGKV